ncbi:MAG TPA: glutamine-hydrolyzing GMP synthase [Melioribacteraceae bacterium]|nr:glutamine-hydrolyzing GMP synthase [Melioribacteraceae bacterium]
MLHKETVLILDFGSQYTQLIARRIREINVYSEIHPNNFPYEKIKELNPVGIILSGGPMSVYESDSLSVDVRIFDLGIPILGVCYGIQLITKIFGGKVEPAQNREYGKTSFKIVSDSLLFKDVNLSSTVWMSHGDIITDAPIKFNITGVTEDSPIASFENTEDNIYGLQFHPEVAHTIEGYKIISNFVFEICKCTGSWNAQNFIEESVDYIKRIVGNSQVICALSGGVDSTVAAILVNKAIGNQLTCIHVDTGLMRLNESENFVAEFREQYKLNLISVNAEEEFLKKLTGIVDPEQKRKIIGNTFIEIFEREANKLGIVDFLVQGTLYPDVIESVPVKGSSVTIKTHHNVGGLPEIMKLKLIEPFRELFKDEVRKIGVQLGIKEDFIYKHPFPGPGLAVRIIGEITKDKLDTLREADDVFISELKQSGIYNSIWQAFAVFLPIQSVGVMGDNRTYENVIALRAVTSTDGMTADWYKFDYNILDNISNKIIRKVKGVNRVVYDISSKPPSTIEWE